MTNEVENLWISWLTIANGLSSVSPSRWVTEGRNKMGEFSNYFIVSVKGRGFQARPAGNTPEEALAAAREAIARGKSPDGFRVLMSAGVTTRVEVGFDTHPSPDEDLEPARKPRRKRRLGKTGRKPGRPRGRRSKRAVTSEEPPRRRGRRRKATESATPEEIAGDGGASGTPEETAPTQPEPVAAETGSNATAF